MNESTALAAIRRAMLRTLHDEPRRALELFVADDPLDLATRAALIGDDDGHLLDPADAAADGYLELVREPAALEDIERWLREAFPPLVHELALDAPSPEVLETIEATLGLDRRPAARWILAFRERSMPDRREVLALMRAGSRAFRQLYPGAQLHPKRDDLRVARAYSTLKELIAHAATD